MLIEIGNLEKEYTITIPPTRALRGVSFNIAEGEFVAIMGPSGSGKSSLMAILGFLDRPTKGSYKFERQNTEKLNDKELAEIRNKKIGFVFQAFNLIPRISVLENIKVPLIYSDVPRSQWNNLALNVIKSVGLSHRATHSPAQLSGGEQQRVAIARALVNNPAIILADEPTGNLDSKADAQIMNIFQELNDKGRTIILITHEIDISEHAKRILRIKDGLIEKDESVPKRKLAKETLKALGIERW